ncbi:isocitrate dehydrogenase, NADP-dependent [Campylobacter ureolyticus]|nr:isocitrate dehydrogenase, NADP-dependent [Campylobacter ureolyticus]
MSDIVYTYTDEAPALATFSLYPIIKNFLSKAGVSIEMVDISLAGRVLAAFSNELNLNISDDLNFLGKLTEDKNANIIKLPNISASIPQLNACIKELQEKGFNVPNFINEPKNDGEKTIKEKYLKVLGSAVNPVLRQGNSIRTAAKAVKNYAKTHPHNNGIWNKNVKTEIFYMDKGDFYSNEKSSVFKNDTTLTIKFTADNKKEKILKNDLRISKNEVVDATFMSAKELDKFIEKSLDYALQNNLLYSVHLKATMMKVSDPVIFGHFVKEFFKVVFNEYGFEFERLGINQNNGLKDLFERLENSKLKDEILSKFDEICKTRPNLAMVDSDKGVTNLHIPSDVIIDASIPAMIRNSGKMWDKNGELKECLAVIPDKTYAVVYESMLNDLKKNGSLNPSIIGSVTNVGLMAKKAEEYGSHDKTFVIEEDGKIKVFDKKEKYFEFEVKKGDIFRMTTVKDEAIKNWIKIAFDLAKEKDIKPIFWLDKSRAHDNNLIKIIKNEIKYNEEYEILAPKDALIKTNEIIRSGKDAISATGNVLRDYLTDLYPILELGTSAKMLSIVPLLNGGVCLKQELVVQHQNTRNNF